MGDAVWFYRSILAFNCVQNIGTGVLFCFVGLNAFSNFAFGNGPEWCLSLMCDLANL